jgi:hypothetical protein
MDVVAPNNDAFLLYVTASGLSFYLLLDGLLRVDVHALRGTSQRAPKRGVGWFLSITASAAGSGIPPDGPRPGMLVEAIAVVANIPPRSQPAAGHAGAGLRPRPYVPVHRDHH